MRNVTKLSTHTHTNNILFLLINIFGLIFIFARFFLCAVFGYIWDIDRIGTAYTIL